jgi:hypothetical protein
VSAIAAADTILGVVFGVVVSLGAIFLFAEAVRIYATILTSIDSSSDILSQIEDTLVFKYFY